MDIQAINSQTSQANGTRERAEPGSLGQQEFLKLLVAQMRHQDPINPLDGAEFAAQLAQFNSVEQLIGVNHALGELQQSQEMMSTSLTNTMSASLSGKRVKALADRIYMDAGGSVSVSFRLPQSVHEAEVIVRTENGTEVRRETLQGLASGDHEWQWDGRNGLGERVADGEYQVEIRATGEGGSVDPMIFTEGTVEAVRFTGRGVYLRVNNVDIPITDVEEVGEAD